MGKKGFEPSISACFERHITPRRVRTPHHTNLDHFPEDKPSNRVDIIIFFYITYFLALSELIFQTIPQYLNSFLKKH